MKGSKERANYRGKHLFQATKQLLNGENYRGKHLFQATKQLLNGENFTYFCSVSAVMCSECFSCYVGGTCGLCGRAGCVCLIQH